MGGWERIRTAAGTFRLWGFGGAGVWPLPRDHNTHKEYYSLVHTKDAYSAGTQRRPLFPCFSILVSLKQAPSNKQRRLATLGPCLLKG